MVSSDPAYCINTENIAHEVLDGEAILINFKTGSYYSLDGMGGAIWAQLSAGAASASALTVSLRASVAEDENKVQSALVDFLSELHREGLVVIADRSVDPSTISLSTASPVFEPPVLRKYTDLEALLLLDPIHDVTVSGWPSARADQQ